jgi:hypothetical protein
MIEFYTHPKNMPSEESPLKQQIKNKRDERIPLREVIQAFNRRQGASDYAYWDALADTTVPRYRARIIIQST